MRKINLFLIGLFIFTPTSCSVEPKPIVFGTDDCDHCKMTISDERFGAELVTKKGRIYKFDDLHCIINFIEDGGVEHNNIASLWGVDFINQKQLVDLEKSWIVKNKELYSPMGSNAASFKTKQDAENYQKQYSGEILEWKTYSNIK